MNKPTNPVSKGNPCCFLLRAFSSEAANSIRRCCCVCPVVPFACPEAALVDILLEAGTLEIGKTRLGIENPQPMGVARPRVARGFCLNFRDAISRSDIQNSVFTNTPHFLDNLYFLLQFCNVSLMGRVFAHLAGFIFFLPPLHACSWLWVE